VSTPRSAHRAQPHSHHESDQRGNQRITFDGGLNLVANTVLRVSGRAGDFVPGASEGPGDAKAGSLRLLFLQFTRRFSETRNIPPEGG
jgi:hypothetical protein